MQTEVNIGDVFGWITVTEKKGKTLVCRCHCGKVFNSFLCRVIGGWKKSCGCTKVVRKGIPPTTKTHGETHGGLTVEYTAWVSMKKRCSDPNYSGYARYGGRGIAVSPLWVSDYPAFLAYVGRKPGPKYQLDRWPDNNGNYEPGNVRWATPTQNARHREMARLRLEDAQEIKRLYSTGLVRQRTLADQFGVSQTFVSHIVLGKAWKDA